MRSHLSYSNVVASVALFAALSGGYALAVGGSGTLQKGGVFGLLDSTDYTTIRILNGIGRIEARCMQGSDADLEINLHASGTVRAAEGIIYRKDSLGGGNSETGTLSPGDDLPQPFDVAAEEDLTRLYIGTAEDDAGEPGVSFKRPQASVEIATFEPLGALACGSARVEVIALNTEG